MERLYTCCCGLDAHKQTVVACLLRPTPDWRTPASTLSPDPTISSASIVKCVQGSSKSRV